MTRLNRIPKNGPLALWHLDILRAIGELQPCSSGKVARKVGKPRHIIERTIFVTFSRRGLIESEVIRSDGKSRRRHGTLRLTAAGEGLVREKRPAQSAT